MLATKPTKAVTALLLLALLCADTSSAQSFANFAQPCAPFSCASGRQIPAPKKCVRVVTWIS